jgi:signal transduction histidine kinase
MWLQPHAKADTKIARALDIVTQVIDGTRQILLGLTGDLSKEQRLLLSRMFAGHADDYRALAEAQGMAFTVNISPGIVVLGTEANLNRLLGNLLQNVIDHGAAGIAELDLRADRDGFRLTIENEWQEGPKAQNPAGNFGLGQASVRNIAAQQGWSFAPTVIDGRYRIVVTGPMAPDL